MRSPRFWFQITEQDKRYGTIMINKIIVNKIKLSNETTVESGSNSNRTGGKCMTKISIEF